MSREEAYKVGKILETADRGCPNCVGMICEEATNQNLGWVFTHDFDENTVIVTPA